jgi:hypothetical protein
VFFVFFFFFFFFFFSIKITYILTLAQFPAQFPLNFSIKNNRSFKRDRPDYTYNVISGPFGAPEGAAETWLKVRVAELGVVDPSRVRSAAVGVRGGFAGVGENIRMYELSDNEHLPKKTGS